MSAGVGSEAAARIPGASGASGPSLADAPAAEAAARRAIAVDPADAGAWLALGGAVHAQGRLNEALEAFLTSISCDEAGTAARNAAAVVLAALGQRDQALEHLRAARARAPGDALLVANTGVVHEMTGSPQAALDAYAEALEIDPTFAPALLNRAPLLASLGRLEEGSLAARAFVDAYPEVAEGHLNVAESELALRRFGPALDSCAACLALDPGNARGHAVRGFALAMLMRFREAKGALQAADRADHGVWMHAAASALAERGDGAAAPANSDLPMPDPRGLYLAQALDRFARCDWDDYDARVVALRDVARGVAGRGVDHRSALFTCWALPTGDAIHRAVAPRVAQAVESRVPPHIWSGGAGPGSRIRIGYVSPDFRQHAAGYAALPLFRLHDRERFETRAYALTPHDGGEVRAEIVARADAIVDLSQMDDESAAWAIFRDGCDLLVDLAGYTRNARPEIMAFRPAAVQVDYHGYHASMGARFVDYNVTSLSTSPAGERDRWAEARCFLPDTHFIYDDETEVSTAPIARADAGLADDAVVYCCFNQVFKIEPESFDAWMRILRGVPGSVLWLLLDDPAVERRLRREAEARGVDARRLVVAPSIGERALHLARTALADVYVDTFWFNGHTTLCDALWAGVPAVTRLGSTPYGRLGASLLMALGAGELVAGDTDEYVEIATRLGTATGERRALREAVLDRRTVSALFDPRSRVRALEAGFTEMVRRERAGEPHADFAIAPVTLVPGPV